MHLDELQLQRKEEKEHPEDATRYKSPHQIGEKFAYPVEEEDEEYLKEEENGLLGNIRLVTQPSCKQRSSPSNFYLPLFVHYLQLAYFNGHGLLLSK